jgi:hypothetical protein
MATKGKKGSEGIGIVVSPVYIGLDTATITGISLWYPKAHLANVVQVKGSPIETFGFIVHRIMPFAGNNLKALCMELNHNFRNAATVRSLSERYGFIKYSLMCNYLNIRICEIGVAEARANLGTKDKQETHQRLSQRYAGPYFTDNHADALAVAIYQSVQDGFDFNFDSLKIRPLEVINAKARSDNQNSANGTGYKR